MNSKLKKITALAAACAVAAFAVACTGGNGGNNNGDGGDGEKDPPHETTALAFTDNRNSGDSFNKSLYYRNDLKLDMGDPMLVYDDGVFYAAGTRGGTSFEMFRSTDLTDWMKIEERAGFTPRVGSWGKTSMWAPDIQKIGDKWYMYYTAHYSGVGSSSGGNCQIGVAVSDTPYGPYSQWTGTNALGRNVGLGDLPFEGMENKTILDSHVFQDDDGKLYMYFSFDTNKNTTSDVNNGTSEIWGVEMKDATTWDITTLTRLVSAGYKTLDGESKNEIPWETWSPSFDEPMECVEGPYMVKHNGKYILTYCANSFVDTEYAVGYAVSDDPLGRYVKPDDTFLQNMICGVPGQLGTYINTRYLGFQTGTGHASICKVGDEYLIAYHAHYNRHKWGELSDIYGHKSEWRALGFDYMHFDENGLPYSNGPTYSLVKLPDAVTGYTNVALGATVEIDGKSGGDAGKLVDNFTNRAFNTDEVNREAQFSAGKHTITLTLPQKTKIKAVNVYNSYDYNKVTKCIDRIDFVDAGYVANVMYNEDYINSETKFAFPHAAYNIELTDEVETNKITITIENSVAFAIGEIEILGRSI